MNTKNKQDQKKNQQQRPQQEQSSKKQGRNTNTLHTGLTHHEQELPETRMTR